MVGSEDNCGGIVTTPVSSWQSMLRRVVFWDQIHGQCGKADAAV
jgi:hypothetical protein